MRKLYEIAVNALIDERCFFCKKPLILKRGYGDGKPHHAWWVKMSYRRMLYAVDKKTVLLTTVHHQNEDRFDNRKANRRWCHRKCHKKHHMQEGHKEGQFKH